MDSFSSLQMNFHFDILKIFKLIILLVQSLFLNARFTLPSKFYLSPIFILKLSCIAMALLSPLLPELLKQWKIITMLFSNILYILLVFQEYLVGLSIRFG